MYKDSFWALVHGFVVSWNTFQFYPSHFLMLHSLVFAFHSSNWEGFGEFFKSCEVLEGRWTVVYPKYHCRSTLILSLLFLSTLGFFVVQIFKVYIKLWISIVKKIIFPQLQNIDNGFKVAFVFINWFFGQESFHSVSEEFCEKLNLLKNAQ